MVVASRNLTVPPYPQNIDLTGLASHHSVVDPVMLPPASEDSGLGLHLLHEYANAADVAHAQNVLKITTPLEIKDVG
eukprot:2435776-Pyramimonas_sp.AAC.3